jgi:hypothetical protein
VNLEKALKFRQNFKAFSRLFQGSPKNPLKTLWKPKALKPTGLFQGFFKAFSRLLKPLFLTNPISHDHGALQSNIYDINLCWF